jgi:sodium- and chloride-dependent transporter, putative tyrosine transporter
MSNRIKFKSRWGFILACVGSAVGMANVWGFPYKIGSNGGAAFLIPYIIFIVLFSYVGLSTEYAIGRFAGTGTLGAYEKSIQMRFPNSKVLKHIGWLPLIGSLCIALGYAVIIAYVVKALFQSITGSLMTVNAGEWFSSFSATDFAVLPYHIVVVVVTLITIFVGAEAIEKTNKIMMPLFFVLFVVIAVRIAFLPNAISGYGFLIKPDFNYLKDPMTWVWAMGQAFFSLSVTGSGMIVYGSYLDDREDVVDGAKNTAIFDTIAAVVATLVMIPACFAYNIDVNGGPGLLFVTLPNILQDIIGGRLFAILLFLAVTFGGISSLQNMLEAVVESIVYKFPKLPRKYVSVFFGIVLLAIGVFMEPISKWGPWMDLVSIYIIPIGASLGAIVWFWVLKKETLLAEVNRGAKSKIGNLWYNLGRYLYVPFAVLLCIIAIIKGISF